MNRSLSLFVAGFEKDDNKDEEPSVVFPGLGSLRVKLSPGSTNKLNKDGFYRFIHAEEDHSFRSEIDERIAELEEQHYKINTLDNEKKISDYCTKNLVNQPSTIFNYEYKSRHRYHRCERFFSSYAIYFTTALEVLLSIPLQTAQYEASQDEFMPYLASRIASLSLGTLVIMAGYVYSLSNAGMSSLADLGVTMDNVFHWLWHKCADKSSKTQDREVEHFKQTCCNIFGKIGAVLMWVAYLYFDIQGDIQDYTMQETYANRYAQTSPFSDKVLLWTQRIGFIINQPNDLIRSSAFLLWCFEKVDKRFPPIAIEKKNNLQEERSGFIVSGGGPFRDEEWGDPVLDGGAENKNEYEDMDKRSCCRKLY